MAEYPLDDYREQQYLNSGILPPDKRKNGVEEFLASQPEPEKKEEPKPSPEKSESSGGTGDTHVQNPNGSYPVAVKVPKEGDGGGASGDNSEKKGGEGNASGDNKNKLDGTAPINGAVDPKFDAPAEKDIKLDSGTGLGDKSNTIEVGSTLKPGQELISDNERYSLRFDKNGNLIFADNDLGQKVLQSGTIRPGDMTGARFDKDSIDVLGGHNMAKGDDGDAVWSQAFRFDKDVADKVKYYRINDDGTIVALGADKKTILGVAYYLGDQKKHFIPIDFPVPPGGRPIFYDTVEAMRRIMQLQVDNLGSGKPSGAPDPEEALKNAGLPTGKFSSEMVDKYYGLHERIKSLNRALDKKIDEVKVKTEDLASQIEDSRKYIIDRHERLSNIMQAPMGASSIHETLEEYKAGKVQREYDKDGNVTSFELSKELEQKLLEAVRSTSNDISKKINEVTEAVEQNKPDKDPGKGTPKDDGKTKDDGTKTPQGPTDTGPTPTGPGPTATGPTPTGPTPNQDWSNTYKDLPLGSDTPGGATGPGATDPKLAKFFNDLANDLEKSATGGGAGSGGDAGDGSGSGGGTGTGTPGGGSGGQQTPGGQQQPGSQPGGNGQQQQPGQQQGGGGMNLGMPLMMMVSMLPQVIGQAAQMMMAQKAEAQQQERYEEERRRQDEERKAEREERKAEESGSVAQASAQSPAADAAPGVATASYGPGAPPAVVMPGGMTDAKLPDGSSQKVSSVVASALNKETYNDNGSDARAAYAGTTGQHTPSNPWVAVDPNSTDPNQRLRTGDVIQWENRTALVVMNEAGLNVMLNGQLVQIDPNNPPDDGHGPFGKFQGFFHPTGIDKAGGDATASGPPTVDATPDTGGPAAPKPIRPQVYT
ncbi:hypothetical protein [Nocardia cyriacigeorgica]|uniref:hypothetical protein n=1 Tax=Nocardia cyriacigeorgica TaxID=135487 RepID=UPI0024588061|nr:hypothetical protein [Nocardia cyriacigeorgica]